MFELLAMKCGGYHSVACFTCSVVDCKSMSAHNSVVCNAVENLAAAVSFETAPHTHTHTHTHTTNQSVTGHCVRPIA